MPPSRKRYQPKPTTQVPEEVTEEGGTIEEYLDFNFEGPVEEKAEEIQEEVSVLPEPIPFVIQEIEPQPDRDPFVDKSAPPVPKPSPTVVEQVVLTPQKRHPRNIPKFSRVKKP